MGREWDAAVYDRVADPMARWGTAVVERLPLRGDELVLDAGSGSGRVTEQLVERLPRGTVIALDNSAAMLDEARRRLARFGDRIRYLHADLASRLPLEEPVDHILSTATFHWIDDHDELFRNLAAVLRPGGRLVAHCGGAGNIGNLVTALASITDRPIARRFATAEDTADRLRAAGFVDVETWLQPEPTVLEPGDAFEAYLESICLREHVAGLDAGERRAFVRRVAAELGEPRLDYVRLNIVATRDRRATSA